MSEIDRIEQLAQWNREEGNRQAAQQLEALAASLREQFKARRATGGGR